jgi:two-component system OmpR family sensor kinase
MPEYEETLRSCLSEVQRVQSLTEELLELARLDSREEPETPQPVAVSEIVAAAVSAVTPEAERRGILVVAEAPFDVLVRAAPLAAKVALANILDNAVKFSPAGGQVRIAVAAVDGEAIIAVSDAGPGVAPDEAERLFQPFYRGRASRSTGAAGVGLGLAISRVLIQRHGGRISLDAPDQRGAKFSVHLPRAERLAEEPIASSAGPPRAAPTTDRD